MDRIDIQIETYRQSLTGTRHRKVRTISPCRFRTGTAMENEETWLNFDSNSRGLRHFQESFEKGSGRIWSIDCEDSQVTAGVVALRNADIDVPTTLPARILLLVIARFDPLNSFGNLVVGQFE